MTDPPAASTAASKPRRASCAATAGQRGSPSMVLLRAIWGTLSCALISRLVGWGVQGVGQGGSEAGA
jgi:hypothetical protein